MTPPTTTTSPRRNEHYPNVRVTDSDEINRRDDLEDGSALVNGIHAVMQSMCSRIVGLTQENSQMAEDIVRLKEEREAMDENCEVS